jgi:hypothetical protein
MPHTKQNGGKQPTRFAAAPAVSAAKPLGLYSMLPPPVDAEQGPRGGSITSTARKGKKATEAASVRMGKERIATLVKRHRPSCPFFLPCLKTARAQPSSVRPLWRLHWEESRSVFWPRSVEAFHKIVL